MSGDASPQTALPASYQTHPSHPHPHGPPPTSTQPLATPSNPLTSTPTHLSSSTSFGQAPDSAGQSIASSDFIKSDGSDTPDAGDDSMRPRLNASGHGSGMKGKNGATGPAEGKTKPHICQICSRAFTTGGHLQRHQRIHTGVKAFKCPYPGCETRTSRQDNLQQHYRTHLSPTLRRGSGSGARQAVAAAMEAAGLKSTSSRAPRKSKGSTNGGTPSSTSSAPATHLPSPYPTPTSQNGPSAYAPYTMYPTDYGYGAHPLPPPGVALAQTQSATSSRVPSPVNGHSSSHSSVGSMPHQQYFPQPFSPAYANYPSNGMQPYRYPAAMPGPYGAPPHHHGLYSSGVSSEHGGGQPLYSPMNTGGFQTHSRESSYGVLTPGYPPNNPMANGYPPRTQTSTPLSQSNHDDRTGGHRYPTPPGRRRTPPDMLSQGVVDPNSMSRVMPMPSGYGGYSHTPYSYGNGNGHHGNGAHGHGGPLGGISRDAAHRASISSLSDGSGAGGSDGSAVNVKGSSSLSKMIHPVG